MAEQNNSILDIGNNLNQIAFEVEAINNDNFDEKLKNINLYIRELEIKKKYLKANSSKKEYIYICDVVHKGIKQISTKLDSVIEKKKEEQKDISSELLKIVNKKKLINYQR